MFNNYNQIPHDNHLKKRLAMHHICQENPISSDHYCLVEKAYGHLVIRVSADNLSFRQALKNITALDAPLQPLQSRSNQDFIVHWISSDEYLLICPANSEFDIEKQLRAEMTGHYAIVNVSSAQTLLELSGARAETILKKATPYDIAASVLTVGKVVTTVFAKTQVVLWRNDSHRFSMIVRRSFSDYLWSWIEDSGKRD